MHPSAHIDTFTRDNLPAENDWPVLRFDLPELAYPPQLNCAAELVDKQVAAGHADRVAIIGKDERWTYRELLENVNRIANVLVDDAGIQPGNRVLLRFPNSPLFAACYLAVLKCGAVAVPTMPLLREAELKVIAEKAKVEFAICDARLTDAIANIPFAKAYTSSEIVDAMASAETGFDPVATASDDVALIAFTSGTTGKPKGCLHFHRDIMSMCHTFSARVLKPKSGSLSQNRLRGSTAS